MTPSQHLAFGLFISKALDFYLRGRRFGSLHQHPHCISSTDFKLTEFIVAWSSLERSGIWTDVTIPVCFILTMGLKQSISASLDISAVCQKILGPLLKALVTIYIINLEKSFELFLKRLMKRKLNIKKGM